MLVVVGRSPTLSITVRTYICAHVQKSILCKKTFFSFSDHFWVRFQRAQMFPYHHWHPALWRTLPHPSHMEGRHQAMGHVRKRATARRSSGFAQGT